MLDRKIYQLSQEGKDVWICVPNQGGRWIERARILDIQGDTVLVRYETEDEEEICSWEELLRIDSIGSIAQRLSTIPKGLTSPTDLLVAEECPESEMLVDPTKVATPVDDSETHGEDSPAPGSQPERDPTTEPLIYLQEEGQPAWDASPDNHD